MAESRITLSVSFDEADTARVVESTIITAKDRITSAFSAGKELFLHEILRESDNTRGIEFDSWWVPELVERDNKTIKLKLAGSPSGTKEQDIVTWLKKSGAIAVNGEMVVDPGADIEVYRIGEGLRDNDSVADSADRERLISIEAKAKDRDTAAAIIQTISEWTDGVSAGLGKSADIGIAVAGGLNVSKAKVVGTASVLITLEGPAGATQHEGLLQWLWENGCSKIASESYLRTDSDSEWVDFVPATTVPHPE